MKKNTSHGSKAGGPGSANGPVQKAVVGWKQPTPLDGILESRHLEPDLTPAEQNELEHLEMVIKNGWTHFLEVGHALIIIQTDRLYRDKYETFEEYCRYSLDMSRSHAYNLIGSTEVFDQLSANADIKVKPQNEFQVRSLIAVPKEKRAWAWKKAEATGKPVTAKLVNQVAAEFKPAKPSYTKPKQSAAIKHVNIGSALKLLARAEQAASDNKDQLVLKELSALRTCLEALAGQKP